MSQWLHRSIAELVKTEQLLPGQMVAFTKPTQACLMTPKPGDSLIDTFLVERPARTRYLEEFVYLRHERIKRVDTDLVFILGLSPEHGTVIFHISENTQVATCKL